MSDEYGYNQRNTYGQRDDDSREEGTYGGSGQIRASNSGSGEYDTSSSAPHQGRNEDRPNAGGYGQSHQSGRPQHESSGYGGGNNAGSQGQQNQYGGRNEGASYGQSHNSGSSSHNDGGYGHLSGSGTSGAYGTNDSSHNSYDRPSEGHQSSNSYGNQNSSSYGNQNSNSYGNQSSNSSGNDRPNQSQNSTGTGYMSAYEKAQLEKKENPFVGSANVLAGDTQSTIKDGVKQLEEYAKQEGGSAVKAIFQGFAGRKH